MPLNHTSEFINNPEGLKDIHDWIDHIVQKYIGLNDRVGITLAKADASPFYIGPFTGKQDNQVLDTKVDQGYLYSGKLPTVEVAYKNIDEVKYD